MLPIKTILHPTDFSKHSESALRFACALARDYDARLLLVHVVEPPVYYGELGMTVPLPSDFHESLHERLSRLVPADAGIPVQTILIEGGAPREILHVAEEQHADLIVLGTHGRSGLTRVLLGSVAESVIRHSSIPVLTLKTPALLVSSGGPEEPESKDAPSSPDRKSRSTVVL
jgi:nucleotide-binding universal stress UspA family protein